MPVAEDVVAVVGVVVFEVVARVVSLNGVERVLNEAVLAAAELLRKANVA